MLNLKASESGAVLVSDLVSEYLDDCRVRNLSAQTLEWYARRLPVILQDHWNSELSALTIQDVKSILATMLETRSPATVNGYMRVLKSMLNYAIDNDYEVSINPRRLKKVREPQRVPPCFTMEQVAALLRQPDRSTFYGMRNYTMMCLMLDVGLRLSELTGLLVSDVNLPYLKVRGKGNKERILAASDVMVKTLRKYLRVRDRVVRRSMAETDLLFPSRTAQRITNRHFDDILKQCRDAAAVTGVRVSAHTFRYTYTSHAVRNGMSLTSLPTCLGHTTLTMSRHYAVLNDADAFEESRACSPLANMGRPNEIRRRSTGTAASRGR